jgi:alkanesulfonate monooxygenase SsuD/methylene tetrahydromethanopterin reductase-like flavin-dependent oxidoreductase (luciferase family)
MTGFIVGESRDDALDRARTLYGRVTRDVDFDTWLERYAARAIIGSVDEARARLHEYEQAGCHRVMCQHLLHTDLEPVRLLAQLSE